VVICHHAWKDRWLPAKWGEQRPRIRPRFEEEAMPTPPSPHRRGPRPRYSREDVVRAAVAIADAEGLDAVTFRAVAARLGTGVMSLYNYIPDRQTLVYGMSELVTAEVELPELTGDWRADMHTVAGEQRDLAHRHPWLVQAVSHLQPTGPGMLAVLEFALGALEPTGLSPRDRLETFAMVNGFVLNIVRAELAAQAAAADPRHQPGQYEMIPELLATGRYPRFAAVVAGGGEPETFEPAVHFDRLLDRVLDGLVRAPAGP
jgi:AcrR family transcriptional regulator